MIVVDSEDHGPSLWLVAPHVSSPITPTVDDRIEVDTSADAYRIHRHRHWMVGNGFNRLGVVSNVVADDAVPNLRDSDEIGGIGDI